MSLVYAHSHADHVLQVGGVSLAADWVFDPVFLLPLALALLYFRGARRYRARGGRRFSAGRQALMGVGLLLTALALLSPVHRLAEWSFTWHMLQHELLMSFAMPAVLLSQPFLPVVWGLPEAFRRRVFIPVGRHPGVQAALRFLTHPVVGVATYALAFLAWHMPALYDAAYRNPWVHYGQHFSFVAGAGLFWWGIITPYPFRARFNVFQRIMVVFLSEVPNVALSAMITFADQVLYAYRGLPGFWGLSMLEEQQIGGLLMWVGIGASVRLISAIAIMIAYGRQEAAKEPPRELYPTREGTPQAAL
jgi:cytochrome c oxidase assembly factor CtaG